MGSTVSYDITRTDHAAVESFIEHLSELGVEGWCSVAALASTESARQALSATLEQLVRRHGLDLEAWTVKDDVETAFHYGVGSSRLALTRRQREATQIARDIARTAAVAVLLRRLVTPEEFESLYRPFATLAARSASNDTDPNRGDGAYELRHSRRGVSSRARARPGVRTGGSGGEWSGADRVRRLTPHGPR